ncbi:hypothetical protein H2203_005988 [Taxawa tesnikishii (nom. ined.)]|nr:hypothetical protein H2203_005988 [Dothideales sp. JES 119]
MALPMLKNDKLPLPNLDAITITLPPHEQAYLSRCAYPMLAAFDRMNDTYQELTALGRSIRSAIVFTAKPTEEGDVSEDEESDEAKPDAELQDISFDDAERVPSAASLPSLDTSSSATSLPSTASASAGPEDLKALVARVAALAAEYETLRNELRAVDQHKQRTWNNAERAQYRKQMKVVREIQLEKTAVEKKVREVLDSSKWGIKGGGKGFGSRIRTGGSEHCRGAGKAAEEEEEVEGRVRMGTRSG